MGKVLMILYRFPPMGGSGVQRGLKFTKYLGDFGWEPMVITARGNVDISEDKSYEKEIPSGLKIWRVPALVPAIVNQIFGINNNAYNSNDFANKPSGFRKIFKFIKERIIFYILIPDQQVIWSMLCIPLIFYICLRYEVDAIFASAYPFSCLFSAVIVGKLFKKRVIMDIRDPLTDGAFYNFRGIKRIIEIWYEKFVLSLADAIIVVNKPLGIHYKQKYPILNQKIFYEIPNGYDEADFKNVQIPIITPQKGVVLVHIGQVYPRSTDILINILSKLREKNQDLFNNLSVRFVGGLPFPEEDRKMLHEANLLHKVVCEKRIDHNLAIKELMNAEILLLLSPADFEVPHMGRGKIYEYLRSGRPILALGPESGVLRSLIYNAECGKYIIKGHEEEAEDFISMTYLNGLTIQPCWSYIRQFERKELTKKLALVLDSICNRQNQSEKPDLF